MKEYILCVYEFLQRRRENQIPGAGVKGRYELPDAGAGNKPRSPGGEVKPF